MRIRTKIMMIALLVMFSTQAPALPCTYDVRGQFGAGSNTHSVTGSMSISDAMVFEYGGGGGYADGTNYHFDVLGFSLLIDGTATFAGDGGGLYFYRQSHIGDLNLYERQWVISNDQANWANPFDGSIRYYTSSMVEYSPLDDDMFGLLAPRISLTAFWEGQYPDAMGMSGPIWLTRETIPNPEPSVIVLLGTAMLLMPLFLRKRNKAV